MMILKFKSWCGAIGLAMLLPFCFNVHAQDIEKTKEQFLHAVLLDNVSEVERYLRAGGDPNVANAAGDPALVVAMREDSPRSREVLLTHPNINVDARSQKGETALMIAAYKGEQTWVDRLLKRQARVDNADGWTALHYAAIQGYAAIVDELLKFGATANKAAPGGITPLMLAARGGHVDVVKLLIKQGADERLANDRGMRAAEFARQHGHTALAEALEKRLNP
ncbi:MAG TPA: ankyrin repeat domain-containing protein [Burkholderiaceae bacterium]|nr:ankyrin repeat domain-containing protein [Burkholderiaceae bacterium]